MKGIPITDVRNFCILGHPGSGKTTLVDAILYKLGINDRRGEVDAGSSMSDFTDEEKGHKNSIYATPFSGEYKSGGRSIGLVMVDTPGYTDFGGMVAAALRVTDGGLITVDASAGLQVGSARAWQLCERASKPRAIVVTGLDKENANFAGTLASIQSTWGNKCVPVTMPAASGDVVDVLAATAPAEDVADTVSEIKGNLVELAAETDDSLIEKYLGGEELSAEEIAGGLRAAVADGGLVPVFACAAPQDRGITELLDGAARLFPSPADVSIADSDGNAVDPDPGQPFSGQVWRSVSDPYLGQLAYLRVFSGTLKADSEIFNASRGQKEKAGACLSVNGTKQDAVGEATAGDIIALAKLKQTHVNDSLCATGQKITYAPIDFPSPCMTFAVSAKSKGDEDKIGTALARIAEEDPTIQVDRNMETKQLLLGGMGDVHLEIAVERMKNRSNVEVELHTPKIPYRETVTGKGSGHYRHKKQSGGRGQYGEVYLHVEPKTKDEEEWFVDAVVGGVIPGNFIPAVQKGLNEGLQRGSIAGFPVMNVKITVYDGSHHAVDSSEIAFKIAGARALRDGMSNAKPILLEPVMNVHVTVPDEFMGDINGDLNHKRGHILGMDLEDGAQIVNAEVPMSELFRYAAELRSMTGGQGSFRVAFSRYQPVPPNITQKIAAAADVVEDED